jgi:uncharacterized phage infection (PIP) family protein YhgE
VNTNPNQQQNANVNTNQTAMTGTANVAQQRPAEQKASAAKNDDDDFQDAPEGDSSSEDETYTDNPPWLQQYETQLYTPNDYLPTGSAEQVHQELIELMQKDLMQDPLKDVRYSQMPRTAIRRLNRMLKDYTRFRQHLVKEAKRLRNSWKHIEDRGETKDPINKLQKYLKALRTADSNICTNVDKLDSVDMLLIAELRTLKDELDLVKTPLNTSLASMDSMQVDKWIAERPRNASVTCGILTQLSTVD